MITCRELLDLLFDYTSGDLLVEQQVGVEQHLSSCGRCAAFVESYRLIIRMARQLPRSPLPPHLERQLRALLQESEAAPDEGSPHGRCRDVP
jgi:anti-sigma factor RsiW